MMETPPRMPMRSMRVPYRQKRNLTTPFELCEARESLAVSKETTYETPEARRVARPISQVEGSQYSVSESPSTLVISSR